MAAGVKPVVYLYGVSESRLPAAIDETGVGRAAIEHVLGEGVVCWISRVPAREFERDLARNLENLDWVASESVAHQRAIAAIREKVDILPARFGTVFRGESSLKRHVLGRLPQLKRDFKRLKGADEWGVKVFVWKQVATPAKVTSGRQYLMAKAALLPKREASGDTNGELGKFREALGRVALASAAPGSISGSQPGLRFQTTILVKRSDRKKLESVLTRFSRRWSEQRKIECSGPWPPYSFVSTARGSADSR